MSDIRPGDLFKASFEHGGDRERMWAEATLVVGEVVYGELRNDPAVLPAKYGDAVWVQRDGILEVDRRQ